MNIFKMKTTAGVLAVFHKAVEQLEQVVENHSHHADKHRSLAQLASEIATKAEEEVQAAEAAIAKLKSFLA
jgi:hypothetical protein